MSDSYRPRRGGLALGDAVVGGATAGEVQYRVELGEELLGEDHGDGTPVAGDRRVGDLDGVGVLRADVRFTTLNWDLDAGYTVLLDKDHLTKGLHSPTYRAYIPVRPSEDAFQGLVEEFFSDAPYVAKCLWRDELLPAKWCLDYDMKHVYLRPLLEWRAECEHGWSIPTGSLGKGLKKLLPPEIWSQLESTFAGAGIAENWEALFRTIALFRRMAGEVAAALGYAYPHDLDERVTAYVRAMRDVDHASQHG